VLRWPVVVEYADPTVRFGALPTFGRVELMGNVALFVAPMLFAAVAMRRPPVALFAGSGLSVGVEALQAAITAIGRSCDTTDWLSNTIGAVIGAGLGWVALRLAGWRSAPAPLSELETHH